MSASRRLSSSSDSSDIPSSHKRKNVKSKRPRIENHLSDPEEGEIPSDTGDEDDGLDEDLYGDEEDKQRLLKMSEKEREEELYRRSEYREALKIRRDVKKRLKERKEKERAERVGKEPTQGSSKISSKPLRSSYASVYSSDSDQLGESDEAIKGGLRDRKLTLAMQKEGRSKRLQELADRRKELKNKKEVLYSGSDDSHSNRSSKQQYARNAIYSSSSSCSEDEEPVRKPEKIPRSVSSYSRSSSAHSSASSDNERGRSRSPEAEQIGTLEQLMQVRLTRDRLETWVHYPFFDELVKGCFVRIHVGVQRDVPIYRISEIVSVKEMSKPYDLGKTRTNKGLVLRRGKDEHTFRIMFVSNSRFLPQEFESFKRIAARTGMKLPTMDFIAKKYREIQKAINEPICDEKVVEQIVQSKRRFRKAPTNFAMRKAELMKQREVAKENNDEKEVERIDADIEELENQAERIERKRTVGFKEISSINQKNRELTLKRVEEALLKEAKEAAESKEEDPFMRIQSQPVIASKEYLQRLRKERLAKERGETVDGEKPKEESKNSKDNTDSKEEDDFVPFKIPIPPPKAPEKSLHAIHDFEIDINVPVDVNGILDDNGSGIHRSASTPIITDQGTPSVIGSVGAGNPRNGEMPARRLLNLQEYKKKREIPQPPRGEMAPTPASSKSNADYTHLINLSKQYLPAQPARIPISQSSVKASFDIIHDENLAPTDYIPQGAYEVILLVDVRESFNKIKFDEIVRARGVKWEHSSLPVGDFVWLAREVGGSTMRREIVLGLVAERKRADDLASSIVDGRFVEQKSRMQRLGFRKMYIFEECRNMYNLRISHETLLQAMINSELVDGCDVVTCSNSDQCTAYLTSLTNFLTKDSKKYDLAVYSGGRRPKKDPHSVEGLWGIPWSEYVDIGKKSPELPLREQFGLHLLQIHSITGAKAKDIVSLFPTPRSLLEAYDRLSSEDEKKALLGEGVGSSNRKSINKKVSEIIFHLYNTL
nr:RNA polymerase associated protein RTF1 [Hymenolepis microstoma]